MTADQQQCHRCGRDVEHRPNYPEHDCEHGELCRLAMDRFAPDKICCIDCEERRLRRLADRRASLLGQVSASLTPLPLASMGGKNRSGIAEGSETGRRK